MQRTLKRELKVLEIVKMEANGGVQVRAVESPRDFSGKHGRGCGNCVLSARCLQSRDVLASEGTFTVFREAACAGECGKKVIAR